MQPQATSLGPRYKCPAGNEMVSKPACRPGALSYGSSSLLLPCCAVACCVVLCFGVAGFLMLTVNWSAIHAECLMPHERTHSCDLLSVAIHKHPLRDHSRGLVGVAWHALWYMDANIASSRSFCILCFCMCFFWHCGTPGAWWVAWPGWENGCGIAAAAPAQEGRVAVAAAIVEDLWGQRAGQQCGETRGPPTVGSVPVAVKLGRQQHVCRGGSKGLGALLKADHVLICCVWHAVFCCCRCFWWGCTCCCVCCTGSGAPSSLQQS